MTKKAIPKSSRTKNGDCFVTNGNYFLLNCHDDEQTSYYLVHGVVLHGEEDFPMLHCWIEVEYHYKFPRHGEYTFLCCIDKSNGHDVELPKEIYYRAGRIKKRIRYTESAFKEKLRHYDHWGAYEDFLLEYPGLIN